MNVLSYASATEKGFEMYLSQICNPIKREYTFTSDLSIADYFGAKNIKSTYKKFIKSFGKNYKAMTELFMSLSYKCMQLSECYWQLDKAKIYADLMDECKDYFYDTFKGNDDAQRYFFDITD